jgi:hypothetical protein
MKRKIGVLSGLLVTLLLLASVGASTASAWDPPAWPTPPAGWTPPPNVDVQVQPNGDTVEIVVTVGDNNVTVTLSPEPGESSVTINGAPPTIPPDIAARFPFVIIAPSITWTPSSVVVNLSPGESETVQVSLTSSRDIASPTFVALPQDGSIQISGAPASITANQTYIIGLTVTLPEAEAGQTAVFGIVKVMDGNNWVGSLQVITVVQP